MHSVLARNQTALFRKLQSRVHNKEALYYVLLLQYVVILNVKESPTQCCINQSKSCTRFQLVSDPRVLPALTLYILDLQNDNNASIVCSKISLFSSVYKSACKSAHHPHIHNIQSTKKSHEIVITV